MDGNEYDVVVVGGGPAGLQAALTLGRMRRSVLLLDSGEYRNAAAHEMHNMLTHDGTAPAQFRAAARAQLEPYDTVQVRQTRATTVTATVNGYRVTTVDGEVVGRTLLLATGLRDTLPSTPGIEELWGDVVAHCPYCHGFEFRDTHVAVLGAGPHAAMLSSMVSRIASRVTVLADGGDLDAAVAKALADAGVTVRAERVTGVRRSPAGATVTLASGEQEDVGGLFVTTALTQSAPFAEQLGLAMLPSGCVQVDELGRTSLPGVYAAGDLAHVEALPMPMASVLTAAAAGLVAASALDRDLVMQAVV